MSREPIPNRPLRGDEIAQGILDALAVRFKGDCHFQSSCTYRRVAYEVSVKVHLSPPTLQHEVRTFTKPDGAIEGQPPLVLAAGEPSEVVAFSQAVEIDNPNMFRVAASLPITELHREPAKPNEMFPPIIETEISYKREDYPEGPEVVEADTSARTAEDWGVPVAISPDPLTEEQLTEDLYHHGLAPTKASEVKPRKRKTPKGRQALGEMRFIQ